MNINSIFKTVFLLIAALALHATAKADTVTPKDEISGIVLDQKNQPLPGAKVEVEGESAYVYTDLDGRFHIKCGPKAKRVVVSYPKMPDVKEKIRPEMTVHIGRTWLDAPDHYQWFAGANVGIALLGVRGDSYGIYGDSDLKDNYSGVNFSIMGGRVKKVGWYAKANVASSSSFNMSGACLGGIFRLGSPLHLYIGVGTNMVNLKHMPYKNLDYPKVAPMLDMGFLCRVKDHFGINWSCSIGFNSNGDISCTSGTLTNLGVSYFF